MTGNTEAPTAAPTPTTDDAEPTQNVSEAVSAQLRAVESDVSTETLSAAHTAMTEVAEEYLEAVGAELEATADVYSARVSRHNGITGPVLVVYLTPDNDAEPSDVAAFLGENYPNVVETSRTGDGCITYTVEAE